MLKSGKIPSKMTKSDSKNTNLENSCRICGNRATYSIFQMIPAYLHETEREYMNWRRPISYYFTFILNQQVSFELEEDVNEIISIFRGIAYSPLNFFVPILLFKWFSLTLIFLSNIVFAFLIE